jgi:hypothetical protein
MNIEGSPIESPYELTNDCSCFEESQMEGVAICDDHLKSSYNQSLLLKRKVCDVQFGNWRWDVWEYDSLIKHCSCMVLALCLWPCDGLAGASLPSSSMISQGLASSFQPSRAFNDFQKHGDRSHGSHDEASQPISGGEGGRAQPIRGSAASPMFPAKPAARPWD